MTGAPCAALLALETLSALNLWADGLKEHARACWPANCWREWSGYLDNHYR